MVQQWDDTESPSVAAGLREAQRRANGETGNLRDQILATFGYDINPPLETYVAQGQYPPYGYAPGNYGPNGVVATQASGAHYSAPGSRAAYERYNIPPVINQRNPFATAAFRTFVDPYGQMSVQPLVGFPSAYPHVLSGVPTNPFSIFGMMGQFPMPFMPPWMWGGMMGGQQQKAAPPAKTAGGGGGGTKKTTAAPAQTKATPPVTPSTTSLPVQPQVPMGGLYDETTWRNQTMPMPPAPSIGPVMEQLPPELGGNINTSPEAFGAGHGANYPEEFTINAQGDILPVNAPLPTSNVPSWSDLMPEWVKNAAAFAKLSGVR